MTQPAPQPVPEFVVVEHLVRFRTTVAVRELEGLTAKPLQSEITRAAEKHQRCFVNAVFRIFLRDAERIDTWAAEIIDGH